MEMYRILIVWMTVISPSIFGDIYSQQEYRVVYGTMQDVLSYEITDDAEIKLEAVRQLNSSETMRRISRREQLFLKTREVVASEQGILSEYGQLIQGVAQGQINAIVKKEWSMDEFEAQHVQAQVAEIIGENISDRSAIIAGVTGYFDAHHWAKKMAIRQVELLTTQLKLELEFEIQGSSVKIVKGYQSLLKSINTLYALTQEDKIKQLYIQKLEEQERYLQQHGLAASYGNPIADTGDVRVFEGMQAMEKISRQEMQKRELEDKLIRLMDKLEQIGQ